MSSDSVAIVLMYHRIADLVRDPWNISVSKNNFSSHMEALRECGFYLCHIRDLFKRSVFSYKRTRVAITFDDGYRDNFENALPVLRAHRAPGTFFVVSGNVGSALEFWWDRLENLILNVSSLPAILSLRVNNARVEFDTAQRSQTYLALWEALSTMSPSGKQGALDDLSKQIHEEIPQRFDYLPLSRDQLRSMAEDSIVEIGSHTVTHSMLARLPPDQQFFELFESKKHLEVMTGRKIRSLSLPHGSFEEGTLTLAREAGYRVVATSINKNVNRRNDLYRVPRRVIQNWSKEEFKNMIRLWLRHS